MKRAGKVFIGLSLFLLPVLSVQPAFSQEQPAPRLPQRQQKTDPYERRSLEGEWPGIRWQHAPGDWSDWDECCNRRSECPDAGCPRSGYAPGYQADGYAEDGYGWDGYAGYGNCPSGCGSSSRCCPSNEGEGEEQYAVRDGRSPRRGSEELSEPSPPSILEDPGNSARDIQTPG